MTEGSFDPVPEVVVREERFAIAGSSIEQLRRVLAAVGPLRGGVRYAAYTDWEVLYRVAPSMPSGMAGALASPRVHVTVSAVMHLPEWHPPSSATDAVILQWQSFLSALRQHEQGHVAIAKAAGEAVASRLRAEPPGAGQAALQRAAELAIQETRTAERAYDDETRHGAAQGAVLHD